MWTPIGYSGIRFMQMVNNVLITLDAFFFTFRVPPVELRADVLPCCCCQNFSFIIDNGRRETINFIQAVLEILKLLDVDYFFEPVIHSILLNHFGEQGYIYLLIDPVLTPVKMVPDEFKSLGSRLAEAY
jgi:hypothetical protein